MEFHWQHKYEQVAACDLSMIKFFKLSNKFSETETGIVLQNILLSVLKSQIEESKPNWSVIWNASINLKLP